MKETEFFVFKKNTDATNTNRGFYYQYLSTLRLWLENRTNNDLEIYCETEDDILEFNKNAYTRNYTQIKCYSSDFSLTSPEVIKSLLNFFNLFLKYQNQYSGTFNFSTTGGIKPRAGKLLLNWYEKQKKSDFNIDEFTLPTSEALIKYITREKDAFLKKNANKKVFAEAEKKLSLFINKINSPVFSKFLKQIRWEFNGDNKESLKITTSLISNLLDKTDYNHNLNINIVISYLLHTIIKKSSEKEIENRILNKKILDELLQNTYSEHLILNTIEKEIVQIINEFLTISNQVKSIKNDTEKILEQLSENKQKYPESALKNLEINLKKWFNAIDYSICEIYKEDVNEFYFTIKVPERRKILNVLILGTIRPIGIKEIEMVEKLRKVYDCDEGWIVSSSYPTPAAADKTNNNEKGQILCYNFDELLEQTMDFSNYFEWVEKEIKEKKINERYIQLAAKKGEYDSKTKEVKATNIYDEKEGWLEGYINTWILDNQKEHISILGEFGTGKTWFTLYYAWQQIQKYKKAKEKKLPRPRIPILIPLRDFSKALQVDVLISDFFFRRHKIEMKGVFSAFEQLNEMGKVLLIFDGFDEMAEKVDKQKMVDNFWELASIISGQSKVILTCRNEHFSSIMEGRILLNSEFRNSTKQLIGETPQFEVIELLKFDAQQIKKVLLFITTNDTINLIFKHPKIVDLLSRPIMTELIIDAIKEIEAGKEINISSVYYYATRRKMERDILQNRTFTSLNDKVLFMCEISWEMFSKDQLNINYKEFPEILYKYFVDKIEDKELDYWRYDMRGQSMLIIDDENGNYKPAHKSFLEFFVALKFAYELGIVKPEFLEDSKGNVIINYLSKSTPDYLTKTVGLLPLTSNKMSAVREFIIPLIQNKPHILWNLYEKIHEQNSLGYLENNLLFLLTQITSDFSNRRLNNLKLIDITFQNSNLCNSDLSNTKFDGGTISNCELNNSSLENVEFNYYSENEERDEGIPEIYDINGQNEFDFVNNNESLISVGRFGINITSITNPKLNSKKIIEFKNKDTFVHRLVSINNANLICYMIKKKLVIYDTQKKSEIFSKEVFRSFFSPKITKCKSGKNFITSSDGFEDNGSLTLWDSTNLQNPIEFNLKNSGIFDSYLSKSDLLLAGGRDGILFSIDVKSKKSTFFFDRNFIAKMVKEEDEKINLGNSEFIYSISLNPPETILAIGTTIRALVLWDYEKNKIFKVLNTKKKYVTKVEFSPDGRYLAYISAYGEVTILSTSNWKPVKTLKNNFYQFTFSSDGKYIAIGTYHDAEIKVIELEKLKIVRDFSFKLIFKNLNIRGLAAPIWYIKFYIKRGGNGWYDKAELMNLSEESFKRLLRLLQFERPQTDKNLSREKKVKRILDYINS